MKHIVITFLLALLCTSCITDPYLLQDKGAEKYYLSDMIGNLENRGFVSPRPVIVIDSVLYRPNFELKKAPLPIYKADISTLNIISSKKVKMLERLGIDPDAGAIVITTDKQKHE